MGWGGIYEEIYAFEIGRAMKKDIPMYGLVLIIIFGAVFLLAEGILAIRSYLTPLNPFPPTTANHQSSISPLWIQENIFMAGDDDIQLVAANGRVIYLGGDGFDKPFHVRAVETKTGNSVWEYKNPYNDAINLAISDPLVIVGRVGLVTALSLRDGEMRWTTYLPYTRSVTQLLPRDNMLYVDTVSSNHFVLDIGTGDILQTIEYTVDNMPNSAVPIWSNHRMGLESLGDNMCSWRRIGPPNGKIEVYRETKYSSTPLWTTVIPDSIQILSNSLGFFALTFDGQVLMVDPVTGAKKEIVRFTPAPQRYYSENGDGGGFKYTYQIAVDSDGHLLFVYLGDGAQLFAFQL